MFAYIYQTTITNAYKFLATTVKYLDDSKDPFEAGDLVETEVRETVKEATQLPAESSLHTRKPREKAIESGKYSKQKGEKISEWRKRIIPRYNELKNVNYNINSKFYTTARLNGFIREIEEIEGFEPDTNHTNLINRKETTCSRCGVDFNYPSLYNRHMIRKKSCNEIRSVI
jgi:hypothetical protein